MTALQGRPETSPARVHSLHALLRRDPDLEERYEGYRRRQVRELLSLLPPDSVRPLYATARVWGRERGMEPGQDPLALLLAFLEGALPLPPLSVWLEDRSRHLAAHLEEEFESPAAHRRGYRPVMVESRPVPLSEGTWRAGLHLFREGGAWRGFITFRSPDAARSGDEEIRTADIFREEEAEEIRERFLSFQDGTLEAFLRSVRP